MKKVEEMENFDILYQVELKGLKLVMAIFIDLWP